VSFKDDFVEALRSVKRDFLRESESDAGAQPEQVDAQPAESGQFEADKPLEVIPAFEETDSAERTEDADDVGASVSGDATPYKSYDADAPLVTGSDIYEGAGGNGRYIDYDESGVYDDNKTIISKNTVIRGALSTEDSIRLLGQVMGDIECKSNIVVAGKVRGNTTAANAYIYDAQVDGDVRCEDVVTVSNDAWVLGNIRAQQAEIDGKIKGNMEIRHMVSIGSSSSILGDISTDELEIKRGAFVNGQIMMYSPSRDVIDRFERFDD